MSQWISHSVAKRFYERLFTAHPSLLDLAQGLLSVAGRLRLKVFTREAFTLDLHLPPEAQSR
jgi:hypothetical protein